MDNINIESTLNFISKMDKKIIDEMDNITFEYNGLKKESEKLLQILNYSPKIIKPTREKIKNMKNIELPQLSELNELDFSKLYINKNQRQEKEKNLMIKNLLMSIIDDMIKNIENKQGIKEAQKNNKTVNEKKISLIKYNSMEINYNSNNNNENKIHELKVFLFNKDDFININIKPEDTINMIKENIINKIIAEKDYEIKYNSLNEYDLRMLTVENDKFNIDLTPIENTKFILENNLKIISFLENDIKKLK